MNIFVAPKRRRIMHSLTINEVSGVDRPAQTGARAMIMKRCGFDPNPGQLAKSFMLMTQAFSGHSHLLQLSDVGGTTWMSSSPGQNPHEHPWVIGSNGVIRIGMAADHTHGIDQDEALAILGQYFKAASGTVAGDILGVPEKMPESLRGIGIEPELPDPGSTPEQRAAIRERNTIRRDLAEREGRLAEQTQPRSLLDVDRALEAIAQEMAADGETMEQSFTRLMVNGDPTFRDLLEERERVAIAGVI